MKTEFQRDPSQEFVVGFGRIEEGDSSRDPEWMGQGDDEWSRSFPRSMKDAATKSVQARQAYLDWRLPDGLPDTPDRSKVPLRELWNFKSNRAHNDLEEHSHDGAVNFPAYDRVDVPVELQEWALKKIELAHQLWQAEAQKGILADRRGVSLPPRSEAEIEDLSLAGSVMWGFFRVEIKDGKATIKRNDQEGLAREVHERLIERHQQWLDQHRVLASKFPKLSNFMEQLSNLKGVWHRPDLYVDLMFDLVAAYHMNRIEDAKTNK